MEQTRFSCPSCKKPYMAPVGHIGQQFKCPCGHAVTVPPPPAPFAVSCHSCGFEFSPSGASSICPQCKQPFALGANYQWMGIKLTNQAVFYTGLSVLGGGFVSLASVLLLAGTTHQGVHNIGLLNEKLAWTVASSSACIVGSIIAAAAYLKRG